MKSELGEKYDLWLETDEGQRCKYPDAYSIALSQSQILEAAFLAGAIANEEFSEELFAKVLEGIT